MKLIEAIIGLVAGGAAIAGYNKLASKKAAKSETGTADESTEAKTEETTEDKSEETETEAKNEEN